MKRRLSLFSLAAAAAAAVTGSCDCGPGPEPVTGDLCGTGQVDGADYAVKSDATELVIGVRKVDAFGCGALHSHVVLAPTATFEYDLENDAAGEVKITVPAGALDADDPDLRKKYLPDGENDPLSDGDRKSIKGSVLEEVKAQEFKNLVFTLKNLSTLDGDGTATLESDIAGATSESDVSYNAKKDGDDVVVSGTATIAGGPHGIPRNALGFCVNPDMELHFTVTLTPGTAECDADGGPDVQYEPQLFDDEECGDVGYNVVYNNVVGPRCMGCHGGILPGTTDTLRGGATVPLVAWEDFRTDSFRNQGRPLYETAHDYVNLPTDDPAILAMPPSANGESTPLQEQLLDPTGVPDTITTEKDLFNAWVEASARDAQCANDVEKKTFTRTEPAADCDAADAIHYDTVQESGGSAQQFFESNCMYCHATGELAAPSAPLVGTDNGDGTYDVDFAAGADDVTHPFYVTADGAPLSFWETSIHRTNDGSMPPFSAIGGYDGDADFEAFQAWVAGGYCE